MLTPPSLHQSMYKQGYCGVEFYGFLKLEISMILILCIINFEIENAINCNVNFGLMPIFFKKLSICLDLIEISVKDSV